VVHDSHTRLACGHAYHTKCIIEALNRVQGCPLCRATLPLEQHDIELHMRMKSYCYEMLDDVKKTELKDYLKDYKSFSNEIEDKRKIFKEKVATFKQELRNEMNIEPTLEYTRKLRLRIRNIFRRAIKKRGGIYATLLHQFDSYHYENKYLFGERSMWYNSMKNKSDFW
jgi:hypothetical protein